MNARSHYEVLGTHRLALPSEVVDAWRKAARALHPDRHVGEPGDWAAKFSEAAAASEVLTDPAKRDAYDRALALRTTECLACKGRGAMFRQRGPLTRDITICFGCGGSGRIEKGANRK